MTIEKKVHRVRLIWFYLFEHSSNIGSVNVGYLMTHKEILRYASVNLVFGEKSGIDLPGESSGLLASPRFWDKGLHMTMSYGYGTSVSIMQMVSAVSALANDGVRVTPHIIKYSPEEEAEKIKRIPTISPQTARTITKLLAISVNNGKSNIKLDKYNVAAKNRNFKKTCRKWFRLFRCYVYLDNRLSACE